MLVAQVAPTPLVQDVSGTAGAAIIGRYKSSSFSLHFSKVMISWARYGAQLVAEYSRVNPANRCNFLVPLRTAPQVSLQILAC